MSSEDTLGIWGQEPAGKSKPTVPIAPPPPPPPTPADSETQVALDKASSEQRKSKGKASTILSNSYGLLEPASTSSRTLLGS